MYISIDSVAGEIVDEPDAYMDGTVAILLFGQGQYTAMLNLPPGVTTEQFGDMCDKLSTSNCCSTPQRAYAFYAQVLTHLRR